MTKHLRITMVLLGMLLGVTQSHAVAIHASADPVKDEPPITAKDREHWAFQPLAKTSADASLEKLSPPQSPPADAATLIRRVTFDLTGLPPLNTDVEKDYEALVDELLATPHYGEHWAQWWLDLARFAETDGFEYDAERSRAWQYRDWVIKALNDDMPFDQFVQQQIAGDLLPNGDASATAFLFTVPDMPDLNNQSERRHVLLNDITSTVGAVGLGLTVGCAQCHDHPYDPISQADFYRLRAFFDNTVLPKERKPLGPSVRVFTEGVPASTVFVRGDFKRPGPEIKPAIPRIFGSTDKSDRAAFAQWLASKDNALFLRAMSNRLWQQHFGKPLAAVPGDLGHQGEAPSNPALLDWLAAELPQQNWSLKKLHKLIVMSPTYRQSSLVVRPSGRSGAPDGRKAELQSPRRLTGEMLRDAMLAVSGQLNLKPGGPGVRLPMPKEVSDTLLKGQYKITDDVTEHTRRSIYVFARRNLRHPLFDLFDRPDAQTSCARRNESTTAPQALTLLNSEFAHDTAAKLATTLTEKHSSDTRAIISAATRLCLSRIATEKEITTGVTFIEQQTKLASSFQGALADYCHALLNSNEFLFVD
jgi:hypothetical protein